MSGKGHNKRRNVGLLYEFLVAAISKALVEGDKRTSSRALKILKKHFKPGTEVYKEFRLFNALRKTTVSSELVASGILQEAKVAARSHDVNELDRQKSLLIRDINHTLNDDDFYDQEVSEYRLFATVQTLLNDWRRPDLNIERIATYEDQLLKHLTTEKAAQSELLAPEESPGTGRLLMKVMMKRLNEKYSGALNDEQKSLIRAYAFSTANDDDASIRLKLEETKQRLLGSIGDYEAQHQDNQYINKKLNEVRGRLLAEGLESVDDSTVARFMLYTKLASELGSGDDGEADNG